MTDRRTADRANADWQARRRARLKPGQKSGGM